MSNFNKIVNSFINWGIGGLVLNGIMQLSETSQNPSKKFDFDTWLKTGCQFGLFGAGASMASIVLNYLFHGNYNTSEYLEDVLASYDIGKNDKFMIAKGYKIIYCLVTFKK